ncbi:MAG: hypothetical protein NDJ90_11370 [Oligoflexia bacterium]|nr:hypothetical protein [Oligoflexia bacterium]
MKKALVALVALLTTTGVAVNQNAQYFILDGNLANSDGTAPLTEVVDLTIGIYSPDGACLLYEESQAGIDLAATDGAFSVKVGSALGHAKRTANDPGKAMAPIFANAGTAIRTAGANCPAGYTPATGDGRKLRLTISSLGVTVTLTPDQEISSVPQATVAETLQGLNPSDFIRSSGNVTQATLGTLTGTADASTLHHHDALYAKLTGSSSIILSSGSMLGLGTRATDPAGLTAADVGKTWYDSTANAIKFWNGSSTQTLGIAGAGLTSLNGLTGTSQTFATGSSGTGPNFSSTGTTHTLNIPLASSNASVAAGLLSNAEYTALLGKETAISAGTTSQYYRGDKTWQALSTASVPENTNLYFTAARAKAALSSLAPVSYNFTTGEIGLDTVPVSKGGTGRSTLGAYQTLVTNGLEAVSPITASGAGQVLMQSSLTSLPSYGYIGDSNIMALAISDSKLATISTAGKVSNSATTATSANTASAIVARDGSGGFSAGTISATFSGDGSAMTSLNATNLGSGTIPAARMPALSGDVTTTAGTTATTIATGAVTTTKLATGAVTSDQIGAGAVTPAKLASTIGVWAATGPTDVFRSGKVGIGTTTPTVALEVVGNVKATGVAAGDFGYTAPKTRYLRMAGGGCTGEYIKLMDIMPFECYIDTALGSTVYWPVSLPHGATITEFRVYGATATSLNVATCALTRGLDETAFNGEELASVTVNTFGALYQPFTSTTITSGRGTINSTDYAYVIYCARTAGGDGITIANVRIGYTVGSPD